ILKRTALFQEDMLVVTADDFQSHRSAAVDNQQDADPLALTYRALMHGLRDYVRGNGFDGVLLGLSGGIDSALVAALAVDALGADAVTGILLPSPYTALES